MLDILGYKLKSQHILIGILLVGATLRFWGLGTSEIFNDEGFYAFRAIGNLDYIQNDFQTTPIQWFANSNLPWWTDLSFHDHPKLYFLIQNIFFRLFGDSLFVARLPSALAGILSILLIYLGVKNILNHASKFSAKDSVGYFGVSDVELLSLLSAALLAVNHIHIWISRSALMESMQIAAVLLNIYLFFIFLENRDRWFWFGASLGSSFLIKYTSAFLLPVYFIYILLFDRGVFKNKKLYFSLLVSLLILSPVIIYNLYLYGAVGHFDLQLAFLFKQATPEWRASFGKIFDPFSEVWTNMFSMYSIPFLLLSFLGFLTGIYNLISHKRNPLYLFSSVSIFFITVMLVFVGSAFRFLALLAPFLVILCALYLFKIRDYIRKKEIFYLIILFFIAYEVYFAIDGVFITFPDFGIVKLDQYLDAAFDGKRSLVPPESSNPHLEDIIKSNLAYVPVADHPFMLIYDENLGLSARLWLYARRIYYHGIPAVTTGQFKNLLRTRDLNQLKNYKFYFIKASPYTLLNPFLSIPDGADLETFLNQELNLKAAKHITGYQNLPMFDVYEFTM